MKIRKKRSAEDVELFGHSLLDLNEGLGPPPKIDLAAKWAGPTAIAAIVGTLLAAKFLEAYQPWLVAIPVAYSLLVLSSLATVPLYYVRRSLRRSRRRAEAERLEATRIAHALPIANKIVRLVHGEFQGVWGSGSSRSVFALVQNLPNNLADRFPKMYETAERTRLAIRSSCRCLAVLPPEIETVEELNWSIHLVDDAMGEVVPRLRELAQAVVARSKKQDVEDFCTVAAFFVQKYDALVDELNAGNPPRNMRTRFKDSPIVTPTEWQG